MLPFLTSLLLLLLLLLSHQAIAGGDGGPSLARQFLGPHNTARSALRLRPLVWDPRLARYAERYANRRRGDCALVHSAGPYGENIFWGSGSGWTPAQAVAAWVSERKWYRYGSNSCAGGWEKCGHYTQIVWRTTRRLGCARVNCAGGRGVFIVCDYDPPGRKFSPCLLHGVQIFCGICLDAFNAIYGTSQR